MFFHVLGLLLSFEHTESCNAEKRFQPVVFLVSMTFGVQGELNQMPNSKQGHRLSKNQQVRGIEKALRSRRTPPWLKSSMRRFADRLRNEVARQNRV